ncbi:MAG: carboxypeptidase-like regulatory domain-containing protein [Paludibacteraceae bacterium]|nr:carboxypeptidase-like regulatory domain-containing protein [Paludibacteraceae bacterium]
MTTTNFIHKNKLSKSLYLLLSLFIGFQAMAAEIRPGAQLPDSAFAVFSGIIIGEKNDQLPYAVISVEKTNISTVTNADGEFLLKVPKADMDKNLLISFLGYENLRIALVSLLPAGNKIRMKPLPFTLPPLEVISKDPESIIRKMMENRNKNYSQRDMMMTAFYRETIKKKNTNISLSEAIVEVYKRAYNSSLHDMASLFKSRKSTDYNKLDTLVFKLMGGPFNNIYLDVMRYPDYIFSENIFENYEFKFLKTDQINDRVVYVIDFRQLRHIAEPLFYGNLYVDAETFALAKAEFDMDLTNNDEATRIFVRKKPFNAKINTTRAHYVIDYRLVDDTWYYSYGRIDLGLKINWQKRLFHTFYNSVIEMAATDWSDDMDRKTFRTKDRISPTVVIQDEASGFSDPEFWGEYNIIEPDKSIENAISKIKKQLEK